MARASIPTQSGCSPCVGSVKEKLSGRANIAHAAELLDELILSDQFADFMPLVAYQFV